MRLAECPEIVVMAGEQVTTMVTSERSDSDIDDAATLQAKLPSVRTMYNIGDVADWDGATIDTEKSIVMRGFRNDGLDRKTSYFNVLPLTVRKTRGNSMMDQTHSNCYIVT